MRQDLMQIAKEKLNKYVSFVVFDNIGQIHDGSGILRSVFLDERDRAMAQIKCDKNSVNADVTAIDLSPEERSAYLEASLEGRAAIDAIGQALDIIQKDHIKRADDVTIPYRGEAIPVEQKPEESTSGQS